MRAERPLLASAAFLAAGLSILFCYGTASSGISAAVPWANSNFHLNLVVAGPAAISGVVLTIVGVFLLIWAILGALAWVGSVVAGGGQPHKRSIDRNRQSEPQGADYHAPEPVPGHR